ncbi:MAG TPA: hypothetical protein VG538_05785 [Vicinamibacterales bacterium]|nr:hypothetical protein [Vicinamibacterales bacterium]
MGANEVNPMDAGNDDSGDKRKLRSEHDVLGRTAREALGLRNSERRCTATSKTTGERCGRPPIVGGTVCNHHGGKAPQVIQSARQRLAALVDPAIDTLLRVLNAPDVCEKCGRSDDMSLMLKAAKIVLDRTGYGPKQSITVQHEYYEPPAWISYLTKAQFHQVGIWIREAKYREEHGIPPERPLLAVVATDAEIVSTDENSEPPREAEHEQQRDATNESTPEKTATTDEPEPPPEVSGGPA